MGGVPEQWKPNDKKKNYKLCSCKWAYIQYREFHPVANNKGVKQFLYENSFN